MSETTVILLKNDRENAKSHKFPFHRSYLVKESEAHILPRLFPVSIVFPLHTKHKDTILGTDLTPDEKKSSSFTFSKVTTFTHIRDDTKKGSYSIEDVTHFIQYNKLVCLIPILTTLYFKEERTGARRARISYLTKLAGNSMIQKKEFSFPSTTIINIDGTPSGPPCIHCENILNSLSGQCSLGCFTCFSCNSGEGLIPIIRLTKKSFTAIVRTYKKTADDMINLILGDSFNEEARKKILSLFDGGEDLEECLRQTEQK